MVGNLLLVLGFSLLFGGRGALDRPSSFLSIGLVGFAVVLLLIPAIPGWEGDPERHSLAVLSIVPSVILLVVYVAVDVVLAAAASADARRRRPAGDGRLVAPNVAASCSAPRPS